MVPAALLLLLSAAAAINGAQLSTTEPKLWLPSFITDNMVLSAKQSSIWGKARANSSRMVVSLSVDGSSTQTTPVVDGAWIIRLPAMTGTNRTIQLDLVPISSDSNRDVDSVDRITLRNVAFGEVYFCSGQSNMEMSVSAVFDSDVEIEDSVNYPNLRMFTAARQSDNEPQWDIPNKSLNTSSWFISSPDAFSSDNFGFPSAVCYFAGRERYKQVQSPIGLVMSSWGGQPIEVFSSETAMKQCPGSPTLIGEPPSSLWNGMIYPFHNMQFNGVFWYQGEANSKDPENYACRFPAMIADWRVQFNQAWPFYYVQLAAYTVEDYSLIRAAQNVTTEADVYPAIAIDLGDPTAPFGAIHPRRKQEVGRRLALQLSRRSVQASGPVLDHVDIMGESAHLYFQNDDHLHFFGTAACSECCYTSPFAILDAISGNWTRTPSRPVIEGGQPRLVKVPIPEFVAVVGIRMGWEGYPQCALYNGLGGPDDHQGLPAAPFEWCMYPSGKAPWTGESCALSSGTLAVS